MFHLIHSTPYRTEEITHQTHCDFLFNKSAEELQINPRTAEQAFGALEEKAITLFQQGQLSYFDALGGNNQCHLVASSIANLYQHYLKGNINLQKGGRTSDHRFLQLAFLIGSIFFKQKENTLTLLFPEKSLTPLSLRAKDLSDVLNAPAVLQESKRLLSIHVQAYILTTLRSRLEPNALIQELTLLADEDDLLCGSKKDLKLYCYPKFSGVLVLIEYLKISPLPLIFKAKVLCEHGYRLKDYGCLHGQAVLKPLEEIEAEDQSPSLIVEGFSAPHGDLDMESYGTMRAFCPNGLLGGSPGRKINFLSHQGHIHKLDSPCQACTPCQNETCQSDRLVSEKIKKEALTGFALLHLVSADFTANCQAAYVKRFFKNSPVYPILCTLFEKAYSKSDECGLSSNTPSTFLIEHLYADSFKHAKQTKRLLDAPGITHVEKMLNEN